MSGNLYTVAALFTLSFLFTVLFEKGLIPLLRRHRAGQPILEIGPSWHIAKAGTPTMGGVAFIAAIGVSLLLLFLFFLLWQGSSGLQWPFLVFLYAFLCGAIGFLDDFRKLAKKENKGLSAAQKYFLQLLVSGLFLFLARAFFGVDTAIFLPFTNGIRLELGFFYYPLALLYLTGLVNALNLTDGVDGLLSVTAGVVALFFLLWGYSGGQGNVMMIGAMLLGAVLGFLCFNAHPAKVFMGDTGSLFLGGAVSAVGILTEHPLLLLIACGVFVIEAASVILQVIWFKLSKGKRLFRMAPLHHHFEKIGFGEWQVVALFGISGLLFASLAFLGR
ncbi:MAG: phospho-N-acetylmuramoyl-pentapeptide-transferase [Ruminococcaceae bacterium]|nr:phospho-N-acetylmuramoyl-pentapeptide-transferase [Oscillospiraceae bacterium]